MKIMKVLVALAAVIALLVFTFSFFGTKNIKENEGQTLPIRWEEVNVRTGHSLDDNVISSLTKGKKVILTGVRYDDALVLDDRPEMSWTQIQLDDGTIGWVVTEAIQWH